jgi:hypothetical protein
MVITYRCLHFKRQWIVPRSFSFRTLSLFVFQLHFKKQRQRLAVPHRNAGITNTKSSKRASPSSCRTLFQQKGDFIRIPSINLQQGDINHGRNDLAKDRKL